MTLALTYALLQVLDVPTGEPLRLTSPERLTMSRESGAGLSQPARLILRSDGSGYLLDVRDAAVYRVMRGTRIVGRVGRVGAGPGEFERPGAIGVLGDTLWVADFRLQRFTRFDADGKTVGTQQVLLPPLPRPYVSAMPWALLRDGQAIGPASVAGPTESPTAPDPILVRFRVGTSQLDSSIRLSARNSSRTQQSGSAGARITQPLSDDPIWVASGDGASFVVVKRQVARSSERDTVRVDWYDAMGRRLKGYRIVYRPTRTPSGMRDRLQLTVPSSLPVKVDPASWYVPDYLPPVTSVVLASDGDLWLRREEEGRTLVAWVRLRLSVGELQRIELPKTSSVLESRGSFVWISELDEEEPVVTRYTIAQPQSQR